MFGMGATELLVILAVALLVLGPARLPDLASGLGRAIREFRKASRDLTDQLEVDDSIRKPFMELKTALRDEPMPYDLRPAPLPVAPPRLAEDCLAPGTLAIDEAVAPPPADAPPIGDAAPPALELGDSPPVKV